MEANKAAPSSAVAMPAVAQTWLMRNFSTVVGCAIGAIALGLVLGRSADPVFFLVTASKVVLGLGLVIFIHELGHFLAAKWCDVHVQTFSIGFGPPLFGICAFQWGETNYKIGWLPLGGFVKMVGEGDESDEGEDDPRSFKNKRVWQRMIIISAGVVMNVILGAVFFIGVYMTHGVKWLPAVVGNVDPGGQAWKKGLRSGGEILQVGRRQNPDLERVMFAVMHSREGQKLPFMFRNFDGTGTHETEIEPIKTEESSKPIIGIVVNPPKKTELSQPHRDLKAPYREGSPAAKLGTALQFGDRIVGTSDPDDPTKIKPLPPDPRRPGGDQLDYFEMKRRFQRLGDQPVRLALRRGPDDQQVQVTLDPAFQNTLGLRLRMGEVSAVREGSAAEKAGVRVHTDKEAGDLIVALEVIANDGKHLKFTTIREPGAGEIPLDPFKLPFLLSKWAASNPSDKQVRLTVLRPEDHDARKETVLSLGWDENWTWEDNEPFNPGSSVALNGIGLAYKVQTTIDSVEPNSPAAGEDIERDSVISEVEIRYRNADGESKKESTELKADQGAYLSAVIQGESMEEVTLTLGKDRKVALKPAVDKSWPRTDRGLILEPDVRLVKANGFVDALQMGGQKTVDTIEMIYENLRAMATFRVSFKNVYGPLRIAETSFHIAGENFYDFLVFLALININLAVVNFLPIPVLDGGHMVFLVYEWLRGKPPSDRVRLIATIIGLVFILGLMALAIGLDIRSYLSKL